MIGAYGISNWPSINPDLTNKSGAATVLGGIYQLDILQANAGTTTQDTQMDNVIIPSTAGINSGVPFVVALRAADADGSRSQYCLQGVVQALLNGTVAVGDNLIPVNGQTYLQTNAGTGPALSVAKALVTNAAGPNLGYVLFQGEYHRMNQGTT